MSRYKGKHRPRESQRDMEARLDRITELISTDRGALREQIRWAFGMTSFGVGARAGEQRRTTDHSDPTGNEATDRRRKQLRKAIRDAADELIHVETVLDHLYGQFSKATGGGTATQQDHSSKALISSNDYAASLVAKQRRERSGGGYGA